MFTWNIVFLKKSDKTLIVELGTRARTLDLSITRALSYTLVSKIVSSSLLKDQLVK